MTIKIKMFTKTVCPTCKVAKQQLSFLPVPVEIEEINIETDMVLMPDSSYLEADKYLTDKLESMSTPTFEFEDGHVTADFFLTS